MYDFIGDIHGYGSKLEALLTKLGYHKVGGVYKHSERKVIFLGDYIDRGPEIPLTLTIVRSMVESGNAIAIMGNHEYNALAFETIHEGNPLRPHTPSNIKQYHATLKQFEEDKETYISHLKWFFTLPLFLEMDEFCAVHACWDDKQIQGLKKATKENRLELKSLIQSCDKSNSLYDQIETSLKGKEVALPEGVNFPDKDGNSRTRVRVKWWIDPKSKTFKEMALPYIDSIPDILVEADSDSFGVIYGEQKKPVFFGHYWLKGQPIIQRANVCCLDFSVAKKGYLAAYRFDGEQSLDTNKIVYV